MIGNRTSRKDLEAALARANVRANTAALLEKAAVKAATEQAERELTTARREITSLRAKVAAVEEERAAYVDDMRRYAADMEQAVRERDEYIADLDAEVARLRRRADAIPDELLFADEAAAASAPTPVLAGLGAEPEPVAPLDFTREYRTADIRAAVAALEAEHAARKRRLPMLPGRKGSAS